MIRVPDHMTDKKDKSDIEALRLLKNGEYSHIQRINRDLAVITMGNEVYSVAIGKIYNSSFRPEIGGKIEIRGSVPTPEVVSVELPD